MSKTISRLEALYAALPKIECKKKCHEACGPIAMSRAEWRRIRESGTPLTKTPDLVCSALDRQTNLCTIYAIRPMICRLWGLVLKLACPFGCLPERWLTDEEATEFLSRANEAHET
jgi:Fe-S-cluster containining protein